MGLFGLKTKDKSFFFERLIKIASSRRSGTRNDGTGKIDCRRESNKRNKCFLRMDFNRPQRILGNSDCFEVCCEGMQKAILSERV